MNAPVAAADARISRAWAVLHTVLDPEVPALSLCDLGLVREVAVGEGGTLDVVLTPTYSGCPATELIEQLAREALEAANLGPVHMHTRKSPAWTSDWISPEGRRKLRDYGIAPPGQCHAPDGAQPLRLVRGAARRGEAVAAIECPRCGSLHTERLSAFGSTACKALWRCVACKEPFEQFKPI